MLDWNKVLFYVKAQLALPSSFIEKTDAELIQYLQMVTLPDFSNYYPDWERVGIIRANTTYQHPTKQNWYLIHDEEDLEIFGIRECFFPEGGAFISGHPIVPPMDFSDLPFFALATFKARFFQPFSMWSYNYKFIHPNVVEIIGEYKPDDFVVEYERMQPSDLRKIPNSMQRKFMDLCLADVMIWLGTMRSHYGDGRVQTPFGEIQLNGADLISRGETKKSELMTTFENDAFLSGIVIDTQ